MAFHCPPQLACVLRQARTPDRRYPVRRQPGTVLWSNGRTGNKGGSVRPVPARLARSSNVTPCSEPSGRRDRESSGGPHPADRIGVAASARKLRLGAERIASPFRSLPDRAGPCCGAPGKSGAATGLLRGRFLGGWLAPFFFLGRLFGFFHWPQTADFSIDIDQLASQGLELTKLSDLTFRLTDACQRG
jgi:hypothetical protein